jgi:hypothetical protein
MESLSLKDITVIITMLTTIISPIVLLYKSYKKNIARRLDYLERRQKELEQHIADIRKEYAKSFTEFKDNDHVIITGLIACLEGLVEQGCNGPVKAGLKELKTYLIRKT